MCVLRSRVAGLTHPQFVRPNWFEGIERPRRSGAVAVLSGGQLRLLLPPGFLTRWDRAALEVACSQAASLAGTVTPLELGTLLCEGSPHDRREAAAALLSLGPAAKAAVPALLVALAADDLPPVRWRAVETLRKVTSPNYAFPLLAQALRSDPCRSVRWRVAEALGALSLPSKERAEVLLQAASDQDHWVRWHANRVLRQTDEATLRSIVPRYAADALDATVRAYALRLLAEQKKVTSRVLRRLVAGLFDPVSEVRRSTAVLLARQGIPTPEAEALRGLRLCLQDPRPELRETAVRAIGSLARREGTTRVLLQGALGDPDPLVRAAACEELADSKGTARAKRRWLGAGLSDPTPLVRLKAAISLHKLKTADAEVVTALTSTLQQERPPLEGWRALLTLSNRYERQIVSAISALPLSRLNYLVGEDVAAGTMPTIGLRLWHSKARIRFPNKEGGDLRAIGLGYPWVNAGVHHSWESHSAPLQSRIKKVVKQVSIAVKPFAHAHFIAAVEFCRFIPADLDGSIAPVQIEGRPVGSIIQGGSVSELLNPQGFAATSGRDRLDFLFANDLSFCQYAAFAATAARVQPFDAAHTGAFGAWRRLVERLSQALVDAGLREFVDQEWFDQKGWQSSRYGLRHERHYQEIRRPLTDLFTALRSSAGQRLRRVMGEFAHHFISEVETLIWSKRLSDYSRAILRVLASGAAGGRAASHAKSMLRT